MTGPQFNRPRLKAKPAAPVKAVDMHWLDQAVCASVSDGEKAWFTSDDAAERQQAKDVCLTCPVRPPCRELGKVVGWGVYGGKAYGLVGPQIQDCGPDAGTALGMAAHYAAADQVCSPCRSYTATRKRRERRTKPAA